MSIRNWIVRQFNHFFAYIMLNCFGYVTPELFGAIGDGVADDSQAFINACDYALTTKKRTVKLTKKYRLKQKVSISGDKYMHLTIKGNTSFGSNLDQAKYLEAPINIIAEGNLEGGLIFGSYVDLEKVGFLDYGVRVSSNRVTFTKCVFNRCTPHVIPNSDPNAEPKYTYDGAITLRDNYNRADGWFGEIMIDNCCFALCETSIAAEIGDNGVWCRDSRISNCVAIRGNVFFKGKVSAWQIFGNHIYTTLPFSNLDVGNMQISNNYFDTNQIMLDMTIRSDATCHVSDNLFLKSFVNTDANNKALPVCRITLGATATLDFTDNTCTKNYDASHPEEVFLEISGSGDFSYSGNVSKIKFVNDRFSTNKVYRDSSNLLVMPKHADRSALISDKVIDKNIISVSFDGWDENTITKIAPYLYEKGIPFTVFIGYSDNDPENHDMTTSLLAKYHTLKQYGGEVQMYTGRPAYTYSGSSNYREQFTQITDVYNRFLSWGFGKPKVCSYAAGSSSVILDKFLAQLGIKAGRTTNEIYTAPYICEEAMRYPSFSVFGANWTSFKTNINQLINSTASPTAVQSPKFYMAHRIADDVDDSTDQTNLTESHIKELVDDIYTLITTKNYTAMTLSQFWDYIHFPRKSQVGQHCLVWESDGQHEYVKTEDGWEECNSSYTSFNLPIHSKAYQKSYTTFPSPKDNLGLIIQYNGETNASIGAYKGCTYESIIKTMVPVGDENPKTKGWYELVDNNYVASTDTAVDNNKTYYAYRWNQLTVSIDQLS